MKIAIACKNEVVSNHFGQSESFEIYTIENGIPVFIESLESPAHTHGGSPIFLINTGIKFLICGNLGEKAIQMLNSKGIDVLSGAEGAIEDVISCYAKGTLISKNLKCSGHNHDHECDHD